MANKPMKPTVSEIIELYEKVKETYDESGLWGTFDEDDLIHELDFKNRLQLPKEFEESGIVLPTARDLVDTCVDHTDLFNPRVWVNRKGTSKKSDEEANLLRKFGLGVLYRNNMESTISPLRIGARHYWIHGLAIFKTVWDADRWADRPSQKTGESDDEYAARIDEWRAEHHDSMPIVIQAVHPKHILLDPYHESPLFVFEVRNELTFTVKGRFANWSNPNSKKISEEVEHISFWTKDYRCELYDREPVMKGQVVKHNYGFIPYVAVDTGLGNQDADNKLAKRYVGILRYVKDLLLSESRDYSIGDIILKMQAWPWGWLSGPNAQAVSEIARKFGEYNALPDGVEIHNESPQVPPEALLTWLSVAANYLASHAAPNVVRGMGETGVRSGADRRLLIAEASARYTYSNEAFKHGIAKVLSNCARIMKNVVPGNINVWARTPTDEFDVEIDKAKMKEPFTFYVEFAPISEEDEYRRHDDLERLVASGIGTKEWARKQMSNVDPEALEREELRQYIKQMVLPIIDQYVKGKAGAVLGQRMAADVASGEVPLPQQVQQPQVPGRMTTGVPATAPPGSAQEMQTRLRQMRSQVPMSPTQGLGIGAGGAPYG